MIESIKLGNHRQIFFNPAGDKFPRLNPFILIWSRRPELLNPVCCELIVQNMQSQLGTQIRKRDLRLLQQTQMICDQIHTIHSPNLCQLLMIHIFPFIAFYIPIAAMHRISNSR